MIDVRTYTTNVSGKKKLDNRMTHIPIVQSANINKQQISFQNLRSFDNIQSGTG